MPLIFQYGSNADQNQINGENRLKGGALDRGRALTVKEYKIAFNKWSQQRGCAAADMIEGDGGRRIWGVLYEMSDQDLARLAEIEGASYEQRDIEVEGQGETRTAVTFVVRPNRRRRDLWTSAEYVSHIVTGLRSHDVLEEYIEHVITTAIESSRSATDQEAARAAIHLIETLRFS